MFLSECTVGIYLLYSTCKQPVLRDHLLPFAIRFQFHMRHIPASWARTVHWGMANRDWQNRYVLYLNFKRHVGDTDPSSSVLVEFSYIYMYIHSVDHFEVCWFWDYHWSVSGMPKSTIVDNILNSLPCTFMFIWFIWMIPSRLKTVSIQPPWPFLYKTLCKGRFPWHIARRLGYCNGPAAVSHCQGTFQRQATWHVRCQGSHEHQVAWWAVTLECKYLTM